MMVKILLMLSVAKVFDNPLGIISLGDCAPYFQLQCHTYFTHFMEKHMGWRMKKTLTSKKKRNSWWTEGLGFFEHLGYQIPENDP